MEHAVYFINTFPIIWQANFVYFKPRIVMSPSLFKFMKVIILMEKAGVIKPTGNVIES